MVDRKTRSLLVAKPGTGKTLTALLTGAEMLRNHFSDAVIALSDQLVIREQWLLMIRSINLDFAEAEPGGEYKKHKAYSLTLQDLKGEAERSLIAAAKKINFFIIVDEIHRSNSIENLSNNILKANSSTKFLYISGTVPKSLSLFDKNYTLDTEYIFEDAIIKLPETKVIIASLSPSFSILDKLLQQKIKIDDLQWREFETLISQLLEKDGYMVELTRGTKDGGVDIFASKNLGIAGEFRTVWQAKKNALKNKVDLSVIRELADTRNEFKASKGIIVTTTYLTQGALRRIQRDNHILGKIDRDDLNTWIRKILMDN